MAEVTEPTLPRQSGSSGHGEFVDHGEQRGAEGVARAPAAQAGDHVAGEHRRAVVEAQAVAQGHGPEQAVLADAVAGDHLRLRAELLVDAIERVEDQEAVVAGDEAGGDDRVEDRRVGLGHETESARGLGAEQAGCGEATGE